MPFCRRAVRTGPAAALALRRVRLPFVATMPVKMSARAPNAFDASESGCARTIGTPSLTARGISRSLGMKTSGSRPRTATTSDWLMPTRLCARLRTRRIRFGSYSIRSSVSRPSFVFLSESESSIPTITRSVETSIVVITSAVKPGGVSTTM